MTESLMGKQAQKNLENFEKTIAGLKGELRNLTEEDIRELEYVNHGRTQSKDMTEENIEFLIKLKRESEKD